MLAVDGAGASAAVLALAAAVGGAEGVHASTARCVAADKYDADIDLELLEYFIKIKMIRVDRSVVWSAGARRRRRHGPPSDFLA